MNYFNSSTRIRQIATRVADICPTEPRLAHDIYINPSDTKLVGTLYNFRYYANVGYAAEADKAYSDLVSFIKSIGWKVDLMKDDERLGDRKISLVKSGSLSALPAGEAADEIIIHSARLFEDLTDKLMKADSRVEETCFMTVSAVNSPQFG